MAWHATASPHLTSPHPHRIISHRATPLEMEPGMGLDAHAHIMWIGIKINGLDNNKDTWRLKRKNNGDSNKQQWKERFCACGVVISKGQAKQNAASCLRSTQLRARRALAAETAARRLPSAQASNLSAPLHALPACLPLPAPPSLLPIII